jgi:hypothetical protein
VHGLSTQFLADTDIGSMLNCRLDGQAKALTQKAIELALSGDMMALRICLDRTDQDQ